jgi:DNA-binding response OmpR family regulator
MIPYCKRILVVDDSPTSLVWQLVLLQEERYDTLTATTPEEGVRIAREEHPDLVILDATARHADVVAMAGALRADPRTNGIPILLLISSGSRERALDSVQECSDEHVAKPFQGSEYLRKVRELLVRRAAGGLR